MAMDDNTLERLKHNRPPSPSEIANRHRPFEESWNESVRAYSGQSDDASPPAKKSDPLPRPGDKYRACARFLNRLSTDCRLIHFVKADFTCEGFAYTDLRRLRWLPSSDPGQGPVLHLRFVEADITDVRIEGRNLEDIHYWISEGAMPWVWEQPAGFRGGEDKAVVITRIIVGERER